MKKYVLALICSLAAAGIVFAQTPAPAPQPVNLFSLESQATMLSLGNQSVASTNVSGSLMITEYLKVKTDNLLAPALSLTYNGGGLGYDFNIDKLLQKTVLKPKTFRPYVEASFGVVRTATSTNHFASLFGGGVNYDPAGSEKFTVNLIDFKAAYFPTGTLGANWGRTFSVGVKLNF